VSRFRTDFFNNFYFEKNGLKISFITKFFCFFIIFWPSSKHLPQKRKSTIANVVVWCCHTPHHPKQDLTTLGYRPTMIIDNL
jgi:hypothetical protein